MSGTLVAPNRDRVARHPVGAAIVWIHHTTAIPPVGAITDAQTWPLLSLTNEKFIPPAT